MSDYMILNEINDTTDFIAVRGSTITNVEEELAVVNAELEEATAELEELKEMLNHKCPHGHDAATCNKDCQVELLPVPACINAGHELHPGQGDHPLTFNPWQQAIEEEQAAVKANLQKLGVAEEDVEILPLPRMFE